MDRVTDPVVPADLNAAMGAKYYTHFLYEEPPPKGPSEFRGVVEVTRAMPRSDLKEAARILAGNFACNANDIKVLQWSRLH